MYIYERSLVSMADKVVPAVPIVAFNAVLYSYQTLFAPCRFVNST
jgi:hypothetical protein